MTKDLNYQLDLISKGTKEIFPLDELKEKLKKSIATNTPLKVKLGCDPTRPDIHLGHTVQLNKLRQFQELGHEVIFIIGDYTGLIGDPSDRDSTRPMLTIKEARENAKTYFEQVAKILDIKKAKIFYNSEWLGKLKFEDIILLASRYTVARMLERDDFEKRFKANKPISIQEFLYPLAQAYDSVVIKADIEIGGTDQRFNFAMTRDIQRTYNEEPEIIIINPLLVGLDGVEKMSKSLNNYIGITESPNEIFGKIMSVSDDLMFNYYELLTDKTRDEIEKLKIDCKNNTLHPMELKKNLAYTIVERFHNQEYAKKARENFENTFSKKELPSDIAIIHITNQDLKNGKIWLPKLIVKSNLAPSTSEARRLISQGAVYLDNKKIIDVNFEFSPRSETILKVGPKKFIKIVYKN
jgi:tyrosyl-tRNA synthetase